MAIDTDALALQLQNLVNTVDTFVNGTSEQRVAISSGRTVGTLAGLDKNINSIKYVQKIIDYSKLSDAVLDAAGSVILSVGNVVRVFGETNKTLNRLYQVQTDKTLLQIDYDDIYDLKNTLPYPYNNRLVQQSITQLLNPLSNTIISYSVVPSSIKGFTQFLTGTMKLSSQTVGKEGMIIGKFRIMIWLKGSTLQSEVTWDYQDSMVVTGSTMQANVFPNLVASLDTTNSGYYILSIKPTFIGTNFSSSDSVMIEWFVEGVNRDSFY